jgi:hypothetical protein
MKHFLKKVRSRSLGARDDAGSREEGAILILALAYLVAVSLVVAMLSTWATGDLDNSAHFSSANALTLAATDMTDVAIQYVRTNPLISTNQPVGVPSPAVACWGGASLSALPVINGDQVAVWCSTVWEPLSYETRDVTFNACPISVSAALCQGSNALLSADVRFDDYPPAPARSAPIQDLCSVWCGAGMTVVSWQWGSSTPGSVTGVASSLIFSNEPSDTSADVSTEASVTVTDASGSPVVGDTVTLVQQSGPSSGSPLVPGISSPTSTLTAVTDSSGVAEFTSIVPQLGGNYTLTAVDGTATATSTSFAVSTKKSVITVTSTAPTNATVGGAKYGPVAATATTGDAVIITSATKSVCTYASPTKLVTFVGSGTCTLDFNDPATGNANYSAALQVTQSFPVGGLAGTQVAMALSTSTPMASGTTNVTITMTLENAVGAPVNSSGTTTVVLSDIGSGFFSLANAAAGSPSLDVSFTNGSSTATAYFGDENAGPDTISAVNGTTNWGSVALAIQGGPATQVAITPSSTSPTVSAITAASLTFQLEDQWGNAAVSTGTTTLALSDSGNGFFSTTSGATGAATLNLTFAGGVGTATVYFGNKTSGSDTITANNGIKVWATSTLTLVAGAATTVQITLSPTNPSNSTSTNASVTLQLLDQFGNHASTNGVALTISDSGGGFFYTKSGTTVKGGATATLALTTVSGVATGYFGDTNDRTDTITVSGIGSAVTTPTFTL